MAEVDTRARFRGCLVGLAASDALGTTLEFRRPGSFEPINGMVGGGPFGFEPGQWTDDTSMALCLAASLIEMERFDPSDQMRRYARWWREGYMSSTGRCFDIGITTSRALSRFVDTGEPYSGPTDAMSAGNGSLMRLAPVPMYFVGDPAKALARSADSSRTTHGAGEVADTCSYFAGLLVEALRGVSKEEILSPLYCPVEGYLDRNPLAPNVAVIAGGSFKHKDPPDIRGTGCVADTPDAVLWAFHRTDDFREGGLRVLNLGDDADTTGAIYGQIAGACYGVEDIPPEWQRRMARGGGPRTKSPPLVQSRCGLATHQKVTHARMKSKGISYDGMTRRKQQGLGIARRGLSIQVYNRLGRTYNARQPLVTDWP